MYMYASSCIIHVDTEPSEKVIKIISNTRFCSDVRKLSPIQQTSSVEAFHSIVISFVPKSTAFSYNGMLTRYSFYHNNI